ncbi:hypothetical protein A4X13_0g4453 [Tilletia indica]|uniref:Uncharacterized protein n=1 Tax=Tilletia indica TaxID=43049 RepID=A0A8T8SXC7_9BASI|nr:hypothetical protein A4X13_0g4453 [Tilletia indica]
MVGRWTLMSSSPGSTYASKNTKWVTHLALSSDIILGGADTQNNIHEISCTMDDSKGQIHSVKLNVWARDTPEQGVYILNNVPFATNPLRLGVGDVATMRRVPDEFDGSEPGSPCLPATPIELSGIAVVASVDEERKSGLLKGFTYLNKGHQWQPFTFQATFPDTPKYEAWKIPGPRSLVHFDATVIEEGPHHILQTSLIRVTLLDVAPASILQALGITNTTTDDRAKRIRQAREARRLNQDTNVEPPHASTSGTTDAPTTPVMTNTPMGPPPIETTPSLHRATSPTPPLTTRKRARADGAVAA